MIKPCVRFSSVILLLSLWMRGADAAVQAPVLKWKNGGAYAINYPDPGWYSSPAVADLDGDGYPDVIGSAYSVFALDGRTGALKWRARSGHQVGETGVSDVGRTWPEIVLADVDGDGQVEIVTAHSGGYVSVYDRTGHFKPGWPWHGAGSSEFRALAVADLEQDGQMEIVVGRAGGSALNTWVLDPNGTVRSGWPQAANNANGYSWGIFNNNIALADINGDNLREVIAPSDVHYICVYNPDGMPVASHSMFGPAHAVWGRVGVNFNFDYDLLGYSPFDVPDAVRANLADSPAVVGDIDGDGTREIIVAGNNYDYTIDPYQSLYGAPYIFNADRTRLNRGGFNWMTPPVITQPLLIQDYSIIENVQLTPVLADLDGDGKLEILYSSYDGMMHCFWLDKTEHGQWPFAVHQTADGFHRFAGPPVVADLDNDGKAEVIFGSWTQKGSNSYGKLHIADWQGSVLHEINLPAPTDSSTWNGALASPTLANIDEDPDLEIVLTTAHSGLVAYDLPGTSGVKILWGTGRGSYQRTGEAQSAARTAARHWEYY